MKAIQGIYYRDLKCNPGNRLNSLCEAVAFVSGAGARSEQGLQSVREDAAREAGLFWNMSWRPEGQLGTRICLLLHPSL